MTTRLPIRWTALLLAVLLPAGCAAPAQESHATAVQQAACRQQADQTFQVRNPDATYAADAYVSGTRDTPFSASGAAGDTTSGLPARYSRETLYSNCLNGMGPPLGGGPTTATPAAAGTMPATTTTRAPPPP
jgi:hypothetical protein